MGHTIKDYQDNVITFKSSDVSGEKIPHVNIDTIPLATGAATAAKQDTLIAKDFATQTTLADILAKLIAAPATEAKQDLIIAALTTLLGYTDGMESLLTAIQNKLIAAPATEAKQDTLIAKDFATQTTLAAVLAKIIAAPSTEAKQDSLISLLTSIIRDEDTAHTSGDKGIPLFGIRSDSDVATANDGDYTLLKLDEEGRIKVASKPASYPDVTGDISAVQPTISAPVAGGTVVADVSRASNVMMFCEGTFAGVNCTFEGSLATTGDTNWFGIQAVRSNANTIETTTGALSAAPAYAWELSVNALARVRIRCTARTSGTQSWRIKLGTFATEPIPAAQITGTQPVSFTQPAQVAGTALMADVGQQYRANATGASSIFKVISAASNNAGVVKASAGRVIGWQLANTTAVWQYVKLHNTSSAPTVGTTAVALPIAIPPGGKSEIMIEGGIGFATGISISILTDAADTGTTATTLNAVIGSIQFA
jgi:hypothetical protein